MRIERKRSRNLGFALDTVIKLFDILMLPIALYASEIWNYENTVNIEKESILNFLS